MNARFDRDWLGLLERMALRVLKPRGRRFAPARDPLPGGIQIRMESEGLLYVEPRATVRETSVL